MTDAQVQEICNRLDKLVAELEKLDMAINTLMAALRQGVYSNRGAGIRG